MCVFCLLRLPNSLLLRFADISHILLICDFDLPYQLSVLSVSSFVCVQYLALRIVSFVYLRQIIDFRSCLKLTLLKNSRFSNLCRESLASCRRQSHCITMLAAFLIFVFAYRSHSI